MNRRWTRMALVAIALAALLALPAGAAAKPKKKRVKPPPPVVTATATESTSVDGQIVSPTATCPPGTIALGGGFSSEVGFENDSPSDIYVVQESRRTSETSWRVSGTREDATPPGNSISLTATVYCQSPNLGVVKKKRKKKGHHASTAKKKKKKKKVKRRTLVVSEVSATGEAAPQGESSSASAACPSGSLIGGGFSVSPPPVLGGLTGLSFPLVYANYAATAQTWTAAEVTSGSTPMTITGYAYCANTQAPQPASGAGSVPPGNVGSATAPPCPADRPVIGGGFNNSKPAAAGSAEVTYESTGSGGGWKVSAFGIASGQGASLQAIALCR